MRANAPAVSIVVATFRTGEALGRLVASLDAQTLPPDRFEAVFVDDGSPDDTFDRLRQLAAERPNVQAFRVPHSGWPSRPRNTGLAHARGEYVLFMDHDDTLYPDALRRAYEYANETGADIVSPKETRTNDIWWGIKDSPGGNIANILTAGGIGYMTPLVPHKLYRRQLLLDHDISFPEGGRVHWEDWFFNLDAYRHATVISVLADEPVYLWHASATNTSSTNDPAGADYWDAVEQVLAHVDTVLRGDGFRDARADALAQHVRGSLIDRLLGLLARPDASLRSAKKLATKRSRKLLRRYGSDEVYDKLPRKHQIQARLLLARRADLMAEFHAADRSLRADVTARGVRWADSRLLLDTELRWGPADATSLGFRQEGSKVSLSVSRGLQRAVPPELLDVTDPMPGVVADLALRGRSEHTTWAQPLPVDSVGFRQRADRALEFVGHARATIDLRRARAGRPLPESVFDVKVRTRLFGMARHSSLSYRGPAHPFIGATRTGVAYANSHGALSLDLAQQLRTVAIDAKPRTGPAGPATAFHAPLDNITAFGPADLDAGQLVAIPTTQLPDDTPEPDHTTAVEQLAPAGDLHARIVVTPTDGATLHGGAPLPPGDYRLYARRAGTLRRTARSVVVDEAGDLRFT